MRTRIHPRTLCRIILGRPLTRFLALLEICLVVEPLVGPPDMKPHCRLAGVRVPLPQRRKDREMLLERLCYWAAQSYLIAEDHHVDGFHRVFEVGIASQFEYAQMENAVLRDVLVYGRLVACGLY